MNRMRKLKGKSKDTSQGDFDLPSSDESEDEVEVDDDEPDYRVHDEEGQVVLEEPEYYVAVKKTAIRIRSDLDSDKVKRGGLLAESAQTILYLTLIRTVSDPTRSQERRTN